MIIDQVTASTCIDAAEFTSDENVANMLLSNVTVKFSDISNSDTRYGNIKSQEAKQVDSETLAKHWNVDLGRDKNNET